LKELSNRELIALCCQKDRSAWSLFVNRFSRVILWAIRDRLKRWNYPFSEQDVEDIYQEILISFWKKGKLNRIKKKDRIVAWLIMVSGNAAVDYFRLKKDYPVRTAVSLFAGHNPGTAEGLGLGDVLGTSAGNPGEVLSHQELSQIVDAVIASLPPGQRSVVTLNFLYGRRQREIARTLNLSTNTVATIIGRTRRRLKQELARKGYKNF